MQSIKRKEEILKEKRMEKEISHLLLNSQGQLVTENTIIHFYNEVYPVQHQVEYNASRSIMKVGEDVATFMSIIKRYRDFQGREKKNKRYQDLPLSDWEKMILRVVLLHLKIKDNKEVQTFFNLQVGRYDKGISEDDISRIKITSGEVIRLLDNQVRDNLEWNQHTLRYEFKKLEAIETNAIKRKPTNTETTFFSNELNKCLIMRDIINLESENADIWLNIKSVISSTKRHGEKIIKGVKKNGESIFD